MADSSNSRASSSEQKPLGHEQIHAKVIKDEQQAAILGTATQKDVDANLTPEEVEAAKDQVDGAIVTGPKKADETTGGRVQVAEEGDLHELAARRKSNSTSL